MKIGCKAYVKNTVISTTLPEDTLKLSKIARFSRKSASVADLWVNNESPAIWATPLALEVTYQKNLNLWHCEFDPLFEFRVEKNLVPPRPHIAQAKVFDTGPPPKLYRELPNQLPAYI